MIPPITAVENIAVRHTKPRDEHVIAGGCRSAHRDRDRASMGPRLVGRGKARWLRTRPRPAPAPNPSVSMGKQAPPALPPAAAEAQNRPPVSRRKPEPRSAPHHAGGPWEDSRGRRVPTNGCPVDEPDSATRLYISTRAIQPAGPVTCLLASKSYRRARRRISPVSASS